MDILIKELPFKSREDMHGMTCFIAPKFVTNAFFNVGLSRTMYGTIVIDGESIEWYYSTLGNDGCFFPEYTPYRHLIKSIIPAFVYDKYLENPHLDDIKNIISKF